MSNLLLSLYIFRTLNWKAIVKEIEMLEFM